MSSALKQVSDTEIPRSEHTHKFNRAFTLAERIDLIREFEKTPSTRYIAALFGCDRTQVQSILRNKNEYLNEWHNNGDPNRIRRGPESARLQNLKEIVYEWIQRCRSCSVAVTDDCIQQTAQRIAELLNISNFRANKKWVEQLKIRFKLTDSDLLGNNPTVTGEGIMKSSLELEDIIQDLQELHSRGKSSKDYYDKVLQNSAERDHPDDRHSTSNTRTQSQNVDGAESCREIYDSVNIKTQGINSYQEAINYLAPLEEFALVSEDLRAVGLINQLENLFREKLEIKEKL